MMKLRQLAKYQRVHEGLKVAQNKFMDKEIKKFMNQRVRRNPLIKSLVQKLMDEQPNLTTVHEDGENEHNSTNRSHNSSFNYG